MGLGATLPTHIPVFRFELYNRKPSVDSECTGRKISPFCCLVLLENSKTLNLKDPEQQNKVALRSIVLTANMFLQASQAAEGGAA